LLRAVVVAVVLLVAFVWGFAKLTSDDGPRSARPVLGNGIKSLEISTSTKIRLSPDGGLIAVVESGVTTVVGVNDAHIVTRAGRNVVDATWMPDSKRLLIVEGPVPTGEIDVVDLKGVTVGVAHLTPSVAFGNGQGVAVDSRGGTAAVIAVTRDPIGGREHTDLAVVDLPTGRVQVFPTPGRDEARPVFVDDGLVAVSSIGESGPARLDIVDVTTGAVTPRRALVDGPFTRTPAGEAVVARGAAQGALRLIAVDPDTGDERTLHVTRPHRQVAAVDVHVTRAMVRVRDEDGTEHLEFEQF
jgi:hypothetical protein